MSTVADQFIHIPMCYYSYFKRWYRRKTSFLIKNLQDIFMADNVTPKPLNIVRRQSTTEEFITFYDKEKERRIHCEQNSPVNKNIA